MKKSGLAFHCHHDILVEFVYDYDERVKFIEEHKPETERELRLRLFKMIPDELIPNKNSKAYIKVGETCHKVSLAYDKALGAFYKAQDAYVKAREAYFARNKEAFEELHSKLCPNCPWNGKTIFSK